MKVCMLVYNNCSFDARVLKEAETLTGEGYQVRIVAVLDRTTKPNEFRGSTEIIRIDRDPLHYRILRVERRLRRWLRLTRSRARRRMIRGRASEPCGGQVGTKRHAETLDIRPPTVAGPSAPGAASASGRQHRPGARPRSRSPAFPHRGRAFAGKSPRQYLKRTLMLFHKPLMYWDWYKRAYRKLRADPADIYHAHDLNTLPVAAALSRATGARLVFDAHELYSELSTLSRTERWVWRASERSLVRRADAC